MSMKLKEYRDIFDNIKKGQAVLLVGQTYLKSDRKYYDHLLKNLKLTDNGQTLNELWKEFTGTEDLDKLRDAMKDAANDAECLPWLRTIMSMGWNCVFTSTTNIEWLLASVGSNFSLNLKSRTELEESLSRSNFRGIFNKKNMPVVPLFGDETNLPKSSKVLRSLKILSTVFEKPCDSILCQYGYLIIDGLEKDDWFNVTKLQNIISSAPNDCVYIFGMTEKKLEDMCADDDNWLNMQDFLADGRLQLCEKTLKEVVEELGLTETIEFDDDDHSGDVKVNIGEDDTLWIERSQCIRMQNMGITLLRDELMSSLILRRRDVREEFANFLMQDSSKDWKYFRVVDEKIKSFHINRRVEVSLRNHVIDQLRKPANKRSIVLLKGNSNTGKTTTLSWLAREVYEKLPHSLNKSSTSDKKKASDRYAVLYINGDPAMYNSKWIEDLTEFIKDKLYDKTTVRNQRVSNVIIIWDNENSQNKWADYEKLNNILNECNIVLVGSIYEFESRKLKQGNRPIEVSINAVLEQTEKNELNILLQKVDYNMYNNFDMNSEGKQEYLFETLTHFAEYNYSPVWQAYKLRLRSRLDKEANKTEDVSNQELTLFLGTQDAVLKNGIGAYLQLQIDQMDEENKKRNEPLRNAIADLNLILAVAGQFKKTVALPESLLLETVIKGGTSTFDREVEKIRKILSLDSMVKYASSAETGVRYVSFRHPSEALAYLYNSLGQDDFESKKSYRKDKEVEVIKRLIKNCDWESTTGMHEAKAVTALIRCFGANSYGKFGEENTYRGNYKNYAAYWENIVDVLNNYACNNPDAMLIVGHFTRELIQLKCNTSGTYFEKNDLINQLVDVFSKMKNIVDSEYNSPSPTAMARLYGEMCRNLLEQIIILDDEDPSASSLSDDFIDIFRKAVIITKECNINDHKVGTILLLDIWLNFAKDKKLEKYLPDTLEYIETLLFDEGELIDDSADLVNVISKINDVYEKIGMQNEDNVERLKTLFVSKGNDSWAYFKGKLELVKVYAEFKKTISKFGSDDDSLSPRIFFLNEYAADDFNNDEDKKLFDEIKAELKKVSGNIISALEDIYHDDIDKMSFRCLRMYLQAKWMYYTGNLILEYNQKPGLTESQWRELNDICLKACSRHSEAENSKRAMLFLTSIYRFAFLREKWDSRRGNEQPNRRICLCAPAEKDGTVCPRIFRVSTKIQDGKVKAKVNKEMINGKAVNTLVNSDGSYSIYVPATVLKKHPEMKNSGISNISHDFEIWFNLGGPQLKDIGDEEA
mgnify:CR=1 FL=1